MKKKLLVGLFTLGAASMLCGFDSAETVDTVMTKMQEASTSATSVCMDMGMNCDIAVNIGDGTTTSTIAILMDGAFDVDATVDPLAMAMEGSMNLSTFGETQAIDMKMYGVTNEEGAFDMYIYTSDSSTGESEWAYDTMEGMEELMAAEATAFTAADYAEYGLVFELASEAADVDGTECYEISAVIDSATLSTMMTKLAETTGEDLTADESVAQAMALLDGMSMKLVYYVDATTFLPVKMHIDMNDWDTTMLNQLLTASMATTAEDGTTDTSTTAELVINDISIDVTTAYDTVTEAITVPEEAIAAVEAGEAESVEELAEAAEEVAM